MNIVDNLSKRGLINPPKHMKSNIHYLCQMGSVAYGCSSDDSDIDIYGFSIPNKNMIFPHLDGHIEGFGKKPKKFDQWQEHHIKDNSSNKEYDITVYNIVKYFQLVMDNNPNMIDSLFVPRRCVLHSTQVGEHLRERRHQFLSKKAWHTFKGYAYAQLNKCKNKKIHQYVELCKKLGFNVYMSLDEFDAYVYKWGRVSKPDQLMFHSLHANAFQNGSLSKRIEGIVKYGYDVKFAYHIVRLLNEVEQILTEHDLDLERNREQLKAIRRGEWTLLEVETYFASKELALEKVYSESTLRYSANEDEIKQILMDCLEMHFGSLERAIIIPSNNNKDLMKAMDIISGVILNLK